jgi:hypothetical protein
MLGEEGIDGVGVVVRGHARRQLGIAAIADDDGDGVGVFGCGRQSR